MTKHELTAIRARIKRGRKEALAPLPKVQFEQSWTNGTMATKRQYFGDKKLCGDLSKLIIHHANCAGIAKAQIELKARESAKRHGVIYG
jgi:hypothetical protein